MRIAQIAPLTERVPPKKYGGTERVIYNLTEELVKRGHKVTLFASGDSLTSAQLVSVYPKALRETKIKNMHGTSVYTMLNIGLAYSQAKDFDIIHDHLGHISIACANISPTPVVMTYHGPFTPENKKMFTALNNPYFVSISKSQVKGVPDLNYIGNVYNGLEMKNYPFSKTPGDYLLFVGRISMEKGVHNAIEVANYLNLPLLIAAKLEAGDLQYFNEYVGPFLSDQIRWVGEVDEKERNKLMSKALCLLHPITWKEPFGLTMIEAMACGCPVIGMNLGSVPEIVEDEKTGFVVEDIEEMIEAVANIKEIDRAICRKVALTDFSASKMAEEYEAIYQNILTIEKSKKKYQKSPSSPFYRTA